MVKGKLEIQKEGCDSYTMDVNDFVLSKVIRASLNCQPGAAQTMNKPAPVSGMPEVNDTKAIPAVPAAAAVRAESPAPAKSSTADDEIEKPLSRLKDLLDRGVITSKEYADQRKRILDSI